MTPAAEQIIRTLRLARLPGEGGFFRATWRSPTASAIYFLITAENFSALHRLTHDEVWHFHAGDPAEHVRLDPAGGIIHRARLGPAVLAGEQPQVVVPAGNWQGARLAPETAGERPRPRHGYALFSCTVSPPWNEGCFELGARAALERDFPAHAAIIRALTR